ncbi:Cep120 protein-domain-containing protein [Phlyctochytrium arcticum]|nr:Cep120 protein-domain-containing protein [Phlyctochytrium arcticum]
MSRPVEHAVLVTVLEGRNFVRKTNSRLYIQCRFNNEILTTDPVDHVTTPSFDTELVWDIESKALGRLRSQRATMKLIVYSIDTNNKRDMVGYFMLDLRGAPAEPAERWCPLVNAKYGATFRPEIKILYAVAPKSEGKGEIEEFLESGRQSLRDKAIADAQIRHVKMRQRKPQAGATSEQRLSTKITSAFSMAVKLSESGTYQIGHGDDLWTFSLTIAFAEHINLLEDRPAPKGLEGQYHFLFSFMGNSITTEKFHDLANPRFSAERITIALQGSFDDISKFLKELSRLIIYLRNGDTVLGFSDVSLIEMVSKDTDDFQPIERMCNMYSIKQDLPMTINGSVPSLGVSMSLQRDQESLNPGEALKSRFARETLDVDGAEEENEQQEVDESDAVDHEDAGISFSQRYPPEPRRAPTPPEELLADETRMSAHLPHRLSRLEPLSEQATPPLTPQAPRTILTQTPPASHGRPPLVPVLPSSPLPNAWHQYRFSIDLRSIKNFAPQAATIYLKYSYPAFGTVAPISTHPPLNISRTPHECLLPHSFCAFEFVMAPDRLQTYLEAVPLVVEMWCKDPFAKDSSMGSATLNMAELWSQPRVDEDIVEGKDVGKAKIQTLDRFAVVVAENSGRVEKIADLRVVLALEDFGAVEEAAPPAPIYQNRNDRPTPLKGRASQPAGARPPAISAASASPPLTPIHATPEYKVALELEMWRAEEEENFRMQLKEREAAALNKLAAEWKAREKERETALKSKMDDFKSLEHKLQDLAQDLAEREKGVRESERVFEKRRDGIEREAKRVVDEARDGARRLHDEYKHRMQVEKGKVAEAERQRDFAIRERDNASTQITKLQNQIVDLRTQAISTPEAHLKERILELERTITSLEGKVAAEKRSKKYYKQQWVKTLKDLAATRKAMQTDIEERLERDREALDERRKGDDRAATATPQVLESIRKDVEELKLKSSMLSHHPGGDAPAVAPTAAAFSASLSGATRDATSGREKLDPSVLFEVERLARERDTLISSGLYTREDRLVRELDRRIKELLAG